MTPSVDQRLDLGQDVAGPAVLLLAAQRRDDAERARVVAADRDRDPRGVRGVARGRQRRREDLSDSRISTCASCCERARSSSAGSEPMLWVPKTTSTHGALSVIVVAVLLRQAAADGDLHVGVGGLERRQVPEVAVELVVGVLAHRAGVEHDHVGLRAGGRGDVPRVLQQPGQALGVVDVHLAPVGADLVGVRRLGSVSGMAVMTGQGYGGARGRGNRAAHCWALTREPFHLSRPGRAPSSPGPPAPGPRRAGSCAPDRRSTRRTAEAARRRSGRRGGPDRRTGRSGRPRLRRDPAVGSGSTTVEAPSVTSYARG